MYIMGTFERILIAISLLLYSDIGGTTEMPFEVAFSASAVEPNIVGRLRSVKILLYASSISRRIEISGNQDALTMLLEARTNYLTSVSLHEGGQDSEAGKVLDAVVQLLMKASRLAKGALDDLDLQETRYKDKEATVIALLAAHHRVADEKNVLASKKEIEVQVNRLILEGRNFAGFKKFVEALLSVEKAYQLIKVSIFSIHNGDTEEAKKQKFSTIQDEFAYEIDRNQSYKMFVFVLLSDRGLNQQTVTTIERLCNQAEALTKKAQDSALRNAYEDALGDLNTSTRLYARAIRLGGVYIPD